MKWPKYIRIQRQEQILKKRLKVPAAIAQFSRTADKALTSEALKLFGKYTPPSKNERKARLRAIAAAKASGEEYKPPAKELQIKFGLNHVTNLVQRKQAQVVLIAHDVQPLEMVGNQDNLGLLSLDEVGDVVQAKLDLQFLGGRLILLARGLGGGNCA